MTASKNALLLLICLILGGFALSCATGHPPTPVGPLVISPAALPAAVINVPYSATLTAVGGLQPFTWALASGTLPPGLTISTSGANGVISGTPTDAGHYRVQSSGHRFADSNKGCRYRCQVDHRKSSALHQHHLAYLRLSWRAL